MNYLQLALESQTTNQPLVDTIQKNESSIVSIGEGSFGYVSHPA